MAYAIYVWDIFIKESIKPHPLSWFVWAWVTGVATAIQGLRGAGWGTSVTLFTAVCCVIIWLVALRKRQRSLDDMQESRLIKGINLTSIAFAFGAIVLYGLVKDPRSAAALVTLADLLGYIPTAQQIWRHPKSDSATAYCLNSVKFLAGFLAITSYSVATWLYPISIFAANMIVFVLLILRRPALVAVHQTM